MVLKSKNTAFLKLHPPSSDVLNVETIEAYSIITQ